MTLRFASSTDDCPGYQLTIGRLLDRSRIAARQQEIVYRDSVVLTYDHLFARIGQLASLLTELEVAQGETVSVMDWDSHRYLEAYFAIPMMGAVLHTVNVRLPAAQIAFTLKDAKADVLLVHRDFLPLVEEIRASLPHLRRVIVMLDGADEPMPEWATGEYEALLQKASSDFPFVDFDENAVATTFYTSGTTGDPKGVCFTHRQIVLHTLAVMAPFGAGRGNPSIGAGDVYMPLTPMFHVHAWGMPYVATMLGLRQVYPGRYEPDLICRLRETHGVTFSHCVPTIIQMILALANAGKADVAGWRIIVGGSALSGTLFKAARAHGMELSAGYGMSETGPFIAMARRPDGVDDQDEDALALAMTSAGQIGPLVGARIVDGNMNPLPHDGATVGELVLRAPWLTASYLGNASASADLWRGGWMHTQDLATIDQHGTVQIRDRIKDVIKTGGEWLDSLRMEELVVSAQGVADVAVIAVADTRWGERPLAIVVPKPGAQVTIEDLNAPLRAEIERGNLSRYAVFDRFELVSQLPKTSVGKVDKRKLREEFGASREVAEQC